MGEGQTMSLGRMHGLDPETVRGGFLYFIRLLFISPVVFITYRVFNWRGSPFALRADLSGRPAILVSNHTNYLFDTMLAVMVGPVWPFTFVRAKVCRLPILGSLYRFFRAIPFIRTDDPNYTAAQRERSNQRNLRWGIRLLRQGRWLSVFPEGSSSSDAKVRPLKPGVAYVALKAEDAAGWNLGLNIFVYGTNYENPSAARSNVFVRWATPIVVAHYRALYDKDPAAAQEKLLSDIEEALGSTVLQADDPQVLQDAHRLAAQRRQAYFSGVQQALSEVLTGKSTPRELTRIVCNKQESLLFQALGFLLLGLSFAIGWPFRTFGKLCASDRSQEMSYQFVLWVLVLFVGMIIDPLRWPAVQVIATILVQRVWLWAWRRGII